ncbi:MAG: hypothetical protein WC310_03375 [Patescibacteria group bacterium]|jgi:hypothetical protein
MKKINYILFGVIVFLGLAFFVPVIAQEEPAQITPEQVNSEAGAVSGFRSADTDELKTAFLQKLGSMMINKRLLSLKIINNRLEKSEKLSSEIKNRLLSEMDRNINGLNRLKDDIANTSDVAILKEKVKSIIADYQIFRVMLPQFSGLVAVDRLEVFSDKIVELRNKVQSKIEEVKSLDGNTAAVEVLVVVADESLSKGNESLQMATEKLFSMQASDPKNAISLKKESKGKISIARAAYKDSEKQLRTAISELKKIIAAAAEESDDVKEEPAGSE